MEPASTVEENDVARQRKPCQSEPHRRHAMPRAAWRPARPGWDAGGCPRARACWILLVPSLWASNFC